MSIRLERYCQPKRTNLMHDIVIFANPIAGAGRAGKLARELADRLQREGCNTRLILEPVDGVDVSQLPHMDAAITIGGDGTLRAVAKKLTESPLAEIPPLLVVPMGTANLMGRHFHIGKSDHHLLERLMRAIRRNEVVHLDAAQANGVPFLLVAGAGIDGEIVHALEKRRTGPIAILSYAIPTGLTLLNYRYPEMTVEVDGQIILRDRPGVVLVGNIPEYGTGFSMLPHAKPDDGLLDVLAIPVASRAEVLTMFMHAVAGEHLQTEGTRYLRGKHVSVTTSEPVAVQADGEAAGFTPLVVDLLPVRIPFIVP